MNPSPLELALFAEGLLYLFKAEPAVGLLYNNLKSESQNDRKESLKLMGILALPTPFDLFGMYFYMKNIEKTILSQDYTYLNQHDSHALPF